MMSEHDDILFGLEDQNEQSPPCILELSGSDETWTRSQGFDFVADIAMAGTRVLHPHAGQHAKLIEGSY